MPIDTSVARWTRDVAVTQWNRDDGALASIGGALPEAIAGERALGEVHRLDLSLFVVFEEVALRVSGALARSAPSRDALSFAAQQTLDEARHHEMFASPARPVDSGLGNPGRGRRDPDSAAAQVHRPLLRGRGSRRVRRRPGADQPGPRGDGLPALRLRGALLEARRSLPGPPDRERVRRRDPARRVRRGAGRRGARRRSRGARAGPAPDRRRAPRDGRSLRLLRPQVRRPVRRGRAPPPGAVRRTPSWNRAGGSPTRLTRNRSPSSATGSTRSTPDCWGARDSTHALADAGGVPGADGGLRAAHAAARRRGELGPRRDRVRRHRSHRLPAGRARLPPGREAADPAHLSPPLQRHAQLPDRRGGDRGSGRSPPAASSGRCWRCRCTSRAIAASSATASSRPRSRSNTLGTPGRRCDEHVAEPRRAPRSIGPGRSHRSPVRLPGAVAAQPPLLRPGAARVRSVPPPGPTPAGARRRARAGELPRRASRRVPARQRARRR